MPPLSFEEEYKKLNKAQKEAVDTIEGPVMVIAGPGTGKTTILTLRIANILKITDTPANGILALTFTEAAAKNMRLKLRQIIGTRADEVRIHTFHGFALSIIREFEDHFPHLSRARQITEVEAESLIREILKKSEYKKLRPFGEPDFYLPKILSTISESKREAWDPDIIEKNAREEIEVIKNDPESISSRGTTKGSLKGEALKRIEKSERTILFTKVFKEYENQKKKNKLIDFDDLLFELLKTLKEDRLLLQLLQEKFLYILLDEHQDTNDTQNLIISVIGSFFESPNLFIVGDEKQAIYRFQGASVENFLSFQKTWAKMKMIQLKENYRSHQSILDASFNMIEKNYEENEHQNLRVKLSSGSKMVPKPIDIITAENEDAEEEYIVENISKILKEESSAEIAVIVRRNREVEELLQIFEENNISAKAERGADIFSHPIGILFFSLLEFLYDPSKIEALAKTISSGLWHLDFEKQVDLLKKLKKGDFEDIEKEMPIISKIRSEINTQSPLNFLILAGNLSGLVKFVKKDEISAEIWRGIINLSQSILFQDKIEDPKILIHKLLEYRETAEHRSIKINSRPSKARVTVMTAHSSKGLEFDYVFLPYAVEEIWIKRNHGSFFVLPRERGEGDALRDERRLFYVALTRAKCHVFITLSLESKDGRSLTPVRFLEELDAGHIKHTDIPTYVKPLKIRNLEEFEVKEKNKKDELTKKVILENGLSFSSLNQFIHSPEEFFEKCILKIPEPLSPTFERGTAMHESISRVWKEVSKNKKITEKEIEEIIKENVKEYFKNSFLPKFEREALLLELTENAKIVAECLLPHFQTEGEIFSESWVEAPFQFESNGEKIDIILHGRLDAIIVKKDKILVFDYKTREGMTERAILEGKDEKRGLFRQLCFYKILVSESQSLKEKHGSKPIELSLVFIRPDNKGRCPIVTIPISDSDILEVKSEITNLLETIWGLRLQN